MGRGRPRGNGGNRGGIISLVRTIQKHEAALDYDLMTKTGRSLGEYLDMGAAGMVALVHFVRHVDPDSALANEAGNTNVGAWPSRMQTNTMLADIFDAIQAFEHNYVRSKSKGKPKRPKPYPRPWAKGKSKKFGKEPVPISKFADWWNSKRKGGEDVQRS